jgi:hypothetical protein
VAAQLGLGEGAVGRRVDAAHGFFGAVALASENARLADYDYRTCN